MTLDKLDVIATGRVYSGKVSDARNACSDAAASLRTACTTVQSYWQGEAGDAMAEALRDLDAEINRIFSGLSELEGQLNSHINALCDNWEEPSEA